jgi:hypothetical protein
LQANGVQVGAVAEVVEFHCGNKEPEPFFVKLEY